MSENETTTGPTIKWMTVILEVVMPIFAMSSVVVKRLVLCSA